jgi:hypothetical protein
MNLDNLKPAWAYYKQSQALETISRQEILDLIEMEEVATYQSARYKYILINSLVFTLNLLLYQSC